MGEVRFSGGDTAGRGSENRIMAKPPSYDWFLREWMASMDPPKIQNNLVNELDWPKARASAVFNGAQRYNRDILNEVAAWLNLKPYELLMHPSEAMAIRGLRRTAAAIVASEAPAEQAEQPTERRTGTRR